MTDFNSINNLNFYINSRNIPLTPLKGSEEGIKNQENNMSNTRSNASYYSVYPPLLYTFQNARMDNEIMLKYLLNLLSLPSTIDKFIKETLSKNKDGKDNDLAKLLTENLLNTKALAEYLSKNSKIAIEKNLRMISDSLKFGIDDNFQLREVLSVLSAIHAQSSSNSNILKEFLLLYIPINGQIFDRETEYSPDSEEEKSEISNSCLSIMLETINFSNILCVLNIFDNNVCLTMYAVESFPFAKFKNIILNFAKDVNIDIIIDYKIKKMQKNDAKKLQNFKIVSKSLVMLNVLVLSHLIVKTIIKIDNDFI